jgi:CheY-like chemotaxis protein
MPIQKVMLVDDDPDILKVGKMSLSGVGKWEVCVALSGKEAIKMAVEQKPDLVIIDTSMPEIDGVTTLTQIRNLPNFQNVPVFMTTTRVEQGEEVFYQSRGANGLIAKPFNPKTLPQEIMSKLQSLGMQS